MTGPDSSSAHVVPAEAARVARPRRRAVSRALGWALVLLALSGAVVFALRYRSARRTSPVRYETAAVDHGSIAARVTATGALSALVTVSVGSQVSGKIDTLSADFGSSVKRGQTIATLEPSLFKSAVAQARANQAAAMAGDAKASAQAVQARRAYQRARNLFAKGLLSAQDLETAEANVGVADASLVAAKASIRQAVAALAQAKLNLDYCTIRSPIDGVVISRNVDIGQTVAAALQAPTLFTIAQDLTKMQVDTNVAEADVGKVRPGMPVTFTVDAYPMRSFSGLVRQVRDNAQTIQNVVTYDAVIDVDNSERLLKPSMTATVTFSYATREAARRVPNAALRFRPSSSTLARMLGSSGRSPASVPRDIKLDERLVWVLRGERPVPIKVRIGISDGESTEVLGGELRDGDVVVTEASVNADAARPGA